jgi:aspartyl-tRNA(Asn)/glutamyl-tRNA(Gln) amidotransferase subunit B
LPLINRDVIYSAIKLGVATNCRINLINQFARKHYFYADLPKGYQITQSDLPICEEGYLDVVVDRHITKKIRIKRIHMEEDAGKNIHSEAYGSLVDLNRAGTPLLEIVTYPDISSAEEAYAYLKCLYGIVTTLGITTGNMEEGAFRADTNISVRKNIDDELGTKCELKNINSFKFIKDATLYEIDRQIDLLESNQKIIQQTRLWDTKAKQTYAMRDKETAADYRYLPDPDIPLISISAADVELVRAALPEFPYAKLERLQKEYGITYDEAEILVSNNSLCAYFEEVSKHYLSPLVINWLLRDLLGLTKEKNISIEAIQFSPVQFALLIKLIDQKQITSHAAKAILHDLHMHDHCPLEYAKKNNLCIEVLDKRAMQEIIIGVLEQNAGAVEELRAGKMKARGFLIGKIMAVFKGKADPSIINALFDELIQN